MIESPRGRASTPEEVAYHEAGHVVVGHLLGLDLIDVDVLPDQEGGNGHTNFRPPPWFDAGPNAAPGEPPDDRRRAFVEAVVITFLAGSLAEARVAGLRDRDGDGFDLDAIVSEWLKRLGDREGAEERLAELGRRAQELVDANWAAIDRLAPALLERRRLGAAEALASLAL